MNKYLKVLFIVDWQRLMYNEFTEDTERMRYQRDRFDSFSWLYTVC